MNAPTILALLLIAIIHSGESLRCWSCSSDIHDNCDDPFTGEQRFISQDCDRQKSQSYYSNNYVACKKIVQMIDSRKQVTRSCSWVNNRDEDHCSSANTHISSRASLVACEYCTTDECNGTASVTASAALILSLIAAKLLA